MISIGTLLVFYLVANALIYRRYVIISKNSPFQTLLFLFLLSSSAIGFSMSLKFKRQRWGLPLFGLSTIIIISFFNYAVPCVRHHIGWSMPFMPWPAALAIFLNVFLMTTLKKFSFERFALWACFITLFYLFYGVHSTYQAEKMGSSEDKVNPSSAVQQTKLDNMQVL